MAQIASAPPAAAATAISPIFGVFGVNFGTIGTSTAALTAAVICFTISGSWPIAIPYPFACGQDKLSSRPSATGAIISATCTNSSILPPKIETNKNLSFGIVRVDNNSAAASAPGLVKPTALTKQPGAY